MADVEEGDAADAPQVCSLSFLILKIHEIRLVERYLCNTQSLNHSNLCNPPSPLNVYVFFINRWTPRALSQAMRATLMRAQ